MAEAGKTLIGFSEQTRQDPFRCLEITTILPILSSYFSKCGSQDQVSKRFLDKACLRAGTM